MILDTKPDLRANEIVCLTGLGKGNIEFGSGAADVAASAVLKNNLIFGSVNANRRHWYKDAQLLAAADHNWLAKLITRVEKPENFISAL